MGGNQKEELDNSKLSVCATPAQELHCSHKQSNTFPMWKSCFVLTMNIGFFHILTVFWGDFLAWNLADSA